MTPLRQRMIDDMAVRNLSPDTIECYVRAVAIFAKHYGKSPQLHRIGPRQTIKGPQDRRARLLAQYGDHLTKARGLTPNARE